MTMANLRLAEHYRNEDVRRRWMYAAKAAVAIVLAAAVIWGMTWSST